MSPASIRASGPPVMALIALATLYTLLNALKPLHVDDPFTHHVATQIAAHPFDPFGSEIFWYQWPQPVHEDLLAPVIGYWGALGLELAGARPFLWKLSLFPFALLFAVSLHALARRFASGLELWVVAATLFSPAFLPSLNYMQDVPAIALGLGALALYLRADERGSAPLAVAAGLVAGLAMQTKWTQCTIPAALLLHGLLSRSWLRPLLAAAAAGLVFAGWELFVTSRYGHGMFLFQLGFPLFWTPRAEMVVPLLRTLGALLPVWALLGLAACGVPRGVLVGLGLALLAGFAGLLVRPVENALYLVSGILCSVALGVAAARSLTGASSAAGARAWIEAHRSELFLVGWLCGELAAYFAVAQFPALRRVLGIVIVATLLVAHVGAVARARIALPLAPLFALQALLGVVVFGVDLLEARAQRDAAKQAFAAARARDAVAPVFFVGHWGFQYYADALGMRALIPDYTALPRGAWLVVPTRVDRQEVAIAPADFELATTVRVPSFVPLATSYGLYAGATPLEHLRGPRIEAQLYRARRDVIPESAWTVAQLADWAMHAGGRQAGWATRALARALERSRSPDERVLAAQALAVAADPARAEPATYAALERAAREDSSPAVRLASARALERLRGPPSPRGADPS